MPLHKTSLKKIVICAGEESGDIHAAQLARELRDWDNTLEISGVGGIHMAEAGVTLVSDIARLGVTGISEVIRHISVIKKTFTAIKNHLKETKPHLLILVDYPGFNLRLARFAKQVLGIKILYYVSPQIWAWRPKRLKVIKENVDRMAVILPFEKEIYETAGVPVSFVGHPLVKQVSPCLNISESRTRWNLPPDKKLLALLPGSRKNEIEKHLPIMLNVAKVLSHADPDLHFVIPIAANLDPNLIHSYLKDRELPIASIQGKATDIVACSDCVVVASGTASLESALLEKPMCIIYRSSLLTYIIATKVLRVKYLGLCNLLVNQMIVPELIQDDYNVTELTLLISRLLYDKKFSLQMSQQLKQMKRILSNEEADLSLFELVKYELS